MTALLTLWSLLPTLRWLPSTSGNPPSWTGAMQDLDTSLIHAGLRQAPRFADTLRWWTGPWVMPGIPFYRPLTSILFWLEWKAFGDREWLYGYPTLAAHAAAALLFTLLAYRLANRLEFRLPQSVGLAAAWTYLGFASPVSSREGVVNISLVWKNQPDLFAAACCFAALICYLRAQEGKQGALAAAGGWYLAGCCFKEIAVPLPLVCMALEVPAFRSDELRNAIRRCAIILALCAGFLLWRYLAIRGIGYVYGSNDGWLQRTLLELLGPFGVSLMGGWVGNALGVWIYGLGWIAWRVRGGNLASNAVQAPRRMLLFITCLTLIGLAGCSVLGMTVSHSAGLLEWHELASPFSWAVGLWGCLDPVVVMMTANTLAFLLSVAILWQRARAVLWLALAWSLAFLAPLIASPGPSHRYYLTQCGYLLLYALAAGAWLELLWSALPRRRAQRQPVSAASPQ
ncbi:MAG TPA: hypothetical protein VK689_17020, partial [Armatimonadota bacterium]|nr:hypothetical protein [Armatimonadota bacterium]